ncbi:MAG: hypothetical protein AMJ53_06385 [Gammaproteobacteria bacterium SG8_11]|nr:MAG: hypothetical protein AMJ53_06385 [Gammaproteobacteria bacterium SG8_11]
MEPELQQRIDQLLMETGEYSPLELLLAESRLMYSDYEAWITGDIEFLEDALFGDPEHIGSMLLQAQIYASKLPMLSAVSAAPPPRQNPSGTGSFSRNNHLNKLFHTVYRKKQEEPQLDLFMDGGASNLVNGITLALSQNNASEARRLLEQLYDLQPDHSKLNDLETLVKFTEQSLDANKDTAGEVDYLQNHLTALAQAHLAQHARDYLVPQWRRLTNALATLPFDPAHPKLHASFTALQALDWHQAKKAIERESHWRQNPILLLRHVQTCTRLWQTAQSILSWFYLCWRFPQSADIDEAQADRDLKNAWLDFLELEPELPVGAFPAWHLLNKPGLLNILPESEDTVIENELYQIIHRLLEAKQARDETQEIALRQQLQKVDAAFFQHFIKRIGSA